MWTGAEPHTAQVQQSPAARQLPIIHPVVPVPNKLCDIDFRLFDSLLIGYNYYRRRFLFLGLQHGFMVHGSMHTSIISPNHRSTLQNPQFIAKKLSLDLVLNRVAGPFETVPMSPFIVSPIGLVPKKEPNKFRIIHDLSFPPKESVNDSIPASYKSVSYEGIRRIVDLVAQLGRGALLAKADIQEAYRILPVHPSQYYLLGFAWDDKFYYDKRLPMGAATSCATFEQVSVALQWILEKHFNVVTVSHIMDDFIFLGPAATSTCSTYLRIFEQLTSRLNIPLNSKKTVEPSTCVTVHGYEVDTLAMEIRLPQDKLDTAKSELLKLLSQKKATLHDIQSITGFLNFTCAVIPMGRPFLRRLINLTCGVRYASFKIRITRPVRADLRMWLLFLKYHNGIPIQNTNKWVSSDTLSLATDLAQSKGFAAVLDNKWASGAWSNSEKKLHISVLEFYPIVLAVMLWGHQLKNKNMLFLCDNMAVVEVINKQSCKDLHLLALLRQLVLSCLKLNIHFRAKHIPGKLNTIPDLISRFQVNVARHHHPELEQIQASIPQEFSLSNLLQQIS